VFSTAFTGQPVQAHEWTVRIPYIYCDGLQMTFSSQNFVAANQFCIRVCQDGPQAPALCNHIYDTMGCEWNMPGDYDTGFTSCRGDDGPVRLVLQSPLAYN
jgi:hypothetical protein